ncbi:MAG: protoporphyrinogen oxidase [Planctomycetes bacterium]|nr:protoporphyrinogen oxidase [Planctomycetota bacterium]
MPLQRIDTVVVGGGISGLAYAHARGPASELVVLEASERAGGLVRTTALGALGEFHCELGPETLRFEARGGLTDMLRELDLVAERPPKESRRRYLVCRGRLVEAPLGVGKFLRTPLLSWRGKLRMIAEPFRSKHLGNDGSVAEFVRHRIGEEALQGLLDPLVSGIHAGDPAVLSMRACFPRLVELVEKHGGLFRAQWKTRGEPAPSVMKTKGGCEAITRALAAALGAKLRLHARVHSFAREGERWLIESDAGRFDAARVVLAMPAAGAAALLAHAAPAIARRISEIESESLSSLVHVYRREQVGHPLAGFGYLVASREKLRHLGTLFSSSIAPDACPPTHVVLRTLLGGARAPHLAAAPELELLDIVRAEVHPLLAIRGEPELVAVQRWRATLPRFDLAHPARVQAIERALPPTLSLLGNYLRGIGVNHLVAAARTLAQHHGP